jgi:hypothetical protein
VSKKKKHKKAQPKQDKPFFLEIHWEKFVIILLFLLPLIYFSSYLSANRMIGGSDYLIGGYPFEKWIGEQEEMPLWYPHVFGGVPVLGSPVGGPLAPLAQLREIMPPHVVLALSFVVFFFLAGLGMYLYLKAIGLSPSTAALAAVIYQFIGNLATTPSAGHAGRAASIAMFPLMLFFIHSALKSKRLLYFVLLAVTTAFAFYEGHFQITYYGLLLILGYVIYYLVAFRKEITRKDVMKILGYGTLSVALICMLMAAIWLPVLGGLGTAARGVERGYAYATSWAMPPLELIDLIIPTFSGIQENYWGINSFKIHLEYFGVIAIILSLFTLVLYWKKRYVKFYAIAALVVGLVAIGSATPFFRIPYSLIPGFRLFRAPALIFYLASFSIIVLGAIGFENILIKRQEVPVRKVYIISGIIIAGLALTALIFSVGGDSIAQSMQDSMQPRLASQWGQQTVRNKISNIQNNYSDLVTGIWRSLLFAGLVIGFIYLSTKRKIRPWIFSVSFIVIALVDQLPFVRKYIPEAPAPDQYYAADDVARYLKTDQTVFRVFPTPWYEHTTDLYLLYHNIQSAGGYIPNPLRRYQEFIGAGQSVMFNPSNLIQYPAFIDMLNLKYIIAPTLPEDVSMYDSQTQRTIAQIRTYLSRYNPVFAGRRYTVYENQNTIPRAHMVHDYEVHNETENLNIMKSVNFNALKTVLLEEDPEVPRSEHDPIPGKSEIIKYQANEIVCQVESAHPGFLVLADNWHPDWQVFVDGEQHKIYVANHTFRAVHLPSGNHEVIFKYVSSGFNLGRIISMISLILALGFCVASVRYRI